MDGEQTPPTNPVNHPSPEEPDTPVGDYVKDLKVVKASKQKRRRNLIILLIILLLAGLVFTYWWLSRPKTNDTKPSQSEQTLDQAQTSQTPQPIQTKEFDSTAFGIKLSYPDTWIIDEVASHVSFTSPVVKLTNVSGETFDGKVVLKVRETIDKLAEFDEGNALAVLESEKIAYTRPASGQRAETYLAFIRYATGNGLESIYVTGDFGYKKDQDVPKVDVAKIDPIINIVFLSCVDQQCANPLPASLQPDSAQTDQTIDQAKQIIKSLIAR